MDPVALVRLVATHLAEVVSSLSDEQTELLTDLAARLAGPRSEDERLEAFGELVDLLLDTLPAGHPVRAELTPEDEERLATAEEAPPADISAAARALIAALGVDPAPGPANPLLAEAHERLASAPAWTPAELAEMGGDPTARGLVRLPVAGGEQLPRFQFDGSGRPYPIVLRVNAVLNAERDPWGAADWWLGGNARLGDVPANLLGRETLIESGDDERRLLWAARIPLEEED